MGKNFEIIDDEEKITCRLCGMRMKRVYGRHMENHAKIDGVDIKKYRKMFPDAPIQTESDRKENSKSSGLHMKEQKYKSMFSEMIRGEKNPNHINNTTEEERKSRSPFSLDFIKYKDLDDKESVIKKFKKEATKDRISTSQKEYWINKGYSEEESTKLVSERQRTFSLDICIEKYGEEEGRKVFTKRQNKWQNSLIRNGNIKHGFSIISQELFYNIILKYKNKQDLLNVFFATKNNEYKLDKKHGGVWIYDYTDENKKKIIEYNGDIYHGNPTMYESKDNPNPFRKNISAEELWKKDEEKLKIAKKNGFEVLTIWDSEYKKNKEEILNTCLIFLNLI